jgi:uncharacterized protein YndB with AHSA1/START domain
MGGYELIAVVVFFLIGYWAVDYFWPKKKAAGRVTVRVQKHFDAAPERVFDAWLDPQNAGKWLFATPTGQMVKVEIDPKVGGRFTFTDRREGDDIEHTGEYFEIDRPQRLAFNFKVPKFSDEATLVRIDIAPAGFGSELTLVHEGVLPEYASRTEEGWAQILQGLQQTLGAGSDYVNDR